MQGKPGKTALFFGSFNPVHIGHLIIAEYFVNSGEVDEVWFVITPQNPFKLDKDLANQQVRKEMLELAIEGILNFYVMI
jgi:nicotinate-nucleotide adenylyltransferase